VQEDTGGEVLFFVGRAKIILADIPVKVYVSGLERSEGCLREGCGCVICAAFNWGSDGPFAALLEGNSRPMGALLKKSAQ